jgi:hypothetical protein
MCGLIVNSKFLKQGRVGLSARFALFYVEGETVVSIGIHIRFLIK